MSATIGSNQKLSRNLNRGIVLKLICTNRNISRIELAKRTGLTRATISNIVNELMDNHLIVEGEEDKNDNVGRNPTALQIASSAPKIIGVMISRRNVTVILSDMKLTVLQEYQEKLRNETNESLAEKICAYIRVILDKEPGAVAIGVAAIGQWDVDNGRLASVVNFGSVKNLQLKAILQEKFGLPVYINNDMTAAALAEKYYGYGKPLHDFVYLGITDGIGCGIVTNNEIYQMNSGLIGEIGHMGINYHGETCPCGNRGCLELYASVPKIVDKLRDVTGLGYNFRQFCDHPASQEEENVFYDSLDRISYALVSVVNLLNCEAIIIGHEGYFLPDRYIEYLEKNINAAKISKDVHVGVMKTAFEQRTPLYGSICCVLKDIFTGDIEI